MDRREVEAVKAAINKAKICKKTIAGYDKEKKAAYIEYANGDRKYADRKPMVLVLEGYNRSGKSTITTFFEKVGKYWKERRFYIWNSIVIRLRAGNIKNS